jgi:hypothetical protein
MGTLDYQSRDLRRSRRWLGRYLWGVGIVALWYGAAATAYSRERDDFLGSLPYFPLTLVPGRYVDWFLDRLSPSTTLEGALVCLFFTNGAFLGFCIIGVWHVASSLRRAMGHASGP